MPKRDTESLKNEIAMIYGDKFSTEKTIYTSSNKPFIATCKIHGDINVRYDHFISEKKGCQLCNKDALINNKWNYYINKANEIHNGKYKYVNDGNFKNEYSKVKILCPIHGEFEQTMNNHVNQQQGCKLCYNESRKGKYKYSLDDIKKLAKKEHGDKYQYIEYNGIRNKLKLICPIHGEFEQIAYDHLRGFGCKFCNTSKLEKEIINFLEENNIEYVYQANSSVLHFLKRKTLDFYLPKYNIAIECQGEQHYRPIDFFGGEKRFIKQLQSDNEKKKLCEVNGIKLLHFTHCIISNCGCIENTDDLLKIIIGETI